MAFNNSNRSLASQRFINSINAIVIQEGAWSDDWWAKGGKFLGDKAYWMKTVVRRKFIEWGWLDALTCLEILKEILRLQNTSLQKLSENMFTFMQMINTQLCSKYTNLDGHYSRWAKGLGGSKNVPQRFAPLEPYGAKKILKLMKEAEDEGKSKAELFKKIVAAVAAIEAEVTSGTASVASLTGRLNAPNEDIAKI